MADFDETLITTSPTAGSQGKNLAVYYRGTYAGVAVLHDDGEYECAVSMERDGQKILQAFGRADSAEQSVSDVAYQWHLMQMGRE